MFFQKPKKEVKQFDREEFYPVIRASICNGEQVAGFKSRKDGRFHEIMLLQTEGDMREFLSMHRLSRNEIVKEY